MYSREDFRHVSYIAPTAKGVITGFGLGYGIGVRPSDFTQDGFYYRALVGYKATEKITIHVDYSAVSLENTTPAAIG